MKALISVNLCAPGNIKPIQCILVSLVICSSFLFMESCKKERLISPAPGKSSTVDLRKTAIDPLLSFTLLHIDHKAGVSLAADYSVTVRNDGLVIYEGRANVHQPGTQRFHVSKEVISELNDLFSEAGFRSVNTCNQIILPGHAYTSTFFFNGRLPAKTVIDNNSGSSAELFSLRNKAEQMLSIKKFTTGIATLNNVTDVEVVNIAPQNDIASGNTGTK